MTGTSGLVLRLAGPLQSWGVSSVFADRDTAPFPTRSGLVGMFAAALGIPRGGDLSRFDPLRVTVRADDPGVPLEDFHTVGGGLPAALTVPTASGGRRAGGTGTLVSRRHYICGAAFTVAATGPGGVVAEIAAALGAPRWQLYLGRRSCPPDEPLLLACVDDAEAELRTRVPLARRPHRGAGAGAVVVDVYTEAPGAGRQLHAELADTPGEATPAGRSYRYRTVYRERATLPPESAHPAGADFQAALYDYIRQSRGVPR